MRECNGALSRVCALVRRKAVMPKSLDAQIESLKNLRAEAQRIEDDYQTVKEEVSQLWKRYFPAAERKQRLLEERKRIKAELAAALDSMPELKTLLDSIK